MKRRYVIGALIIAVILGIVAYVLFGYLPKQRKKQETARAVEEYYAAKLAAYAEENARYADYEVDVAFLGDSLTDGYDLAKYYPQYVTANRGIAGETTDGLEKRLAVSAYELKPKVVVMLIGGNNLDTMFNNYERIVAGLREHLPDTELVLVSLTSRGGDWAHKNHIAAYNNVKIRLIAQKYSCAYVDLFTPLLDPQTDEIRAEYTTDGAHQTDKGYAVFTREITPILEQLLAQ